MDDLKLYTHIKKHLKDLLSCVGRFSTKLIAVCENEDMFLYWNKRIQTHRAIANNIHDLVTAIIEDFAVSLPSNAENSNKYLLLRDEIK